MENKTPEENHAHKEDPQESDSPSDSEEEKEKENKLDKKDSENDSEKEHLTFSERIKRFFSTKKNPQEKNEVLALDENRTIEEIITSKGFNVQQHIVKTEDGYLLSIFRIPGPKHCEHPEKCPPVLFQHGVFDSADGWLMNGEEKSLPFVLANKGFDCWLGNSRGNKYSKNHEKFDVNSYEFWQFSFHDMGIYDEPAIINYIKAHNTSGEKIVYFGHSQGTSLMFSGLTQKFDFYKENLKCFIALAPVVRLTNVGSNLLYFFTKISLDKTFKRLKILEMAPSNDSNAKLYGKLGKSAERITNLALDLVSDSGTKEYNDQNSLNVYFRHFPSGSSLKCLIHYAQIIKAKKFVYYDYRRHANCAMYHQLKPPEYDLSVIKDFPIMLLCGEEDKLGDPQDVEWLKEQLGNNVIYFKVIPKMGHCSFLCGKDFSWFDEPLKIILSNDYTLKNEPVKTEEIIQ